MTKINSPATRLLTELGPLGVWFGTYFLGPKFLPIPEGREIFYALGAFMAAFAIAFVFTLVRERKVSPVLLITGVIVAISGGLTFLFQDRIFTYVKPTLTNATFASILAGGALTGRLFLKLIFEHGFQLTERGWKLLTWRFVGFFVFLAILNEVVWRYVTYGMGCDPTLDPAARCPGEPIWINFKTFGVLPMTLLFTFSQVFLILKHQVPDSESDRPSPPADS